MSWIISTRKRMGISGSGANQWWKGLPLEYHVPGASGNPHFWEAGL
jgi:hypothetical protein